ncbi:hypothetical protein RHSIM_RhsimUnG0018400 [Rhododendron simsii]|uniref:Uncharacterized protein n=1 Tax=Rhododendron simsii TaxID=118357 RepID=A0A834FWU7_RHOSS|nr:hypothetical protein RHSIM_RhsimUnG0018400 [Rhododendron simsii]
MTKISPEFGDQMQMEAVSADVSFASNQFPKYRIGADNQIFDDAKDDPKGPPLKEVVAQETAHLVEQQKRLSVRDLASKFDKNLAAAAKLSDEAKIREVASLEGHVLLKKLRDALEALRGRLAGRNKEDVEKAISMVEALAVKLTQKEGELIQEKFEVKKLANFLKQASEDAKKLVSQERSFACAEIESARAVVQRCGEALEEEERISQTSGKQELEKLLEEVQESRRIKLLHQPSKVIDMEHELQALRIQIREKSIISVKLQREVHLCKSNLAQMKLKNFQNVQFSGIVYQLKVAEGKLFQLGLDSNLGWHSALAIGLSWDGNTVGCIIGIKGANRPIYAPEPFDVGRFLEVDVFSTGQKVVVTTANPIGPAAGLASYMETLLRKPNSEFHVTISQMNGQNYSSRSVHLFHVGKMRMKLCRGWITKARDSYSVTMQLCGFRGGGNSAAKSLFWQARKGQSFVLVFETERERNAAIMLARRYALDCNSNAANSIIEFMKPVVYRSVYEDCNVLEGRMAGEAVGKQKNMAAADGRNRRALGDIGNLVTARGIDAKQITRPKLVPVNVDEAVIVADGVGGKGAKAVAVPKVAQKRVTVKPDPNTVIEISPDTVEEIKIKKPVVNDKKPGDGSSRKKAQTTLTSILTARSKAACGLNDKPKEHILDIDAADIDNELAVVEYVEDMYKFYKLVENESRVHDYMDSQPEINERMRAILVDWLIEVHNKFELTLETLYLTLNIVDRYLASTTVSRRELQLVGLSSMLMASKYEEIWAPEVNDFVCISDRAYTHGQVLVMEKRILGELEWNLTVPTPYVFLVRFIKASVPDQLMENMVHFLAELGIMNYATIIYCPSMLAASAVYAARCTLNKSPVWNDTLKLHTGFSEAQVMDCAKLLVSFHKKAAENSLKTIYRKYSNPQRGAVALFPPAKALLASTTTPTTI